MTHKITSWSVAILSILIVGGSQITQADAATDQQTEENKTNDVVTKDSDTNDSETNTDDTDVQAAEGTFNQYHGGAHWKLDNKGTLTLDSGELSEDTFTYAGDKDYFNTYMSTHNDDIKAIKIGKGMSLSAEPGQPFTCLINLEHIDGLSNLDTTNTVSMEKLFYDCGKLKSLDLSDFDTSGVTNMSSMFRLDRALTSVDLSEIDTSKVTNMNDMFSYCSSLETLDISNFDTSKVTDMESMFTHCEALTNLKLSGIDTSNVTNMSGIFANCEALTKLDVSELNTKNVTNMGGMFSDDHNLEKIDVSNFDTSKVTDMQWMFKGINDVKQLDLSNFDTSNVTNMTKMFWNATSLEDLNLSSFDVNNVTDITSMFLNTPKLKNMKVSNNFNELSKIINGSELEDKTWINVGTGTENNPKPSEKFSFEKWSNLPSEERDNWFIETDAPYPSTNGYTVNVKNNLDKDLTVEVPEKDRPEYIGSTFKVAVPEVEGYVATEKYITVTATENGLISDDTVNYEEPGIEEPEDPDTEEPGDNNNNNSNNNGNNSGNNNNSNNNNNNSGNEGNGDNEENEVEHKQNLVTVHPDMKYANLYDSKGKLVENRALAGNSNWQSDQLVTIKGNKYYRVASNEYVKAEDSYTYEVFDNAVKTKDTEITYMVKSTGKEVQNRGLGNQSSWKADKKVNINGKVYYRVATNEFVGADDTDVI